MKEMVLPTDLESRVEERLKVLIETRITEKGHPNRLHYLLTAKEKGIIENEDAARNWIKGSRPFPLYNLRLITQDLGIDLEEIVTIFGRDPFRPDISVFKIDPTPLGRLVDFYIELKTGKSRAQYLSDAEKKGIIESKKSADSWFYGTHPFPLKSLKLISEDLTIPVEEINNCYGTNPFSPDIVKIRKSQNPVANLVDHYIDLRTGTSGKPRIKYLRDAYKRNIIEVRPDVAQLWFGREIFPLRYLKSLVDDLEVPLDELVAVYGSNPFRPSLGEIKQRDNPLGQLLMFYIELKVGKTGKSLTDYLNAARRERIIENVSGASGWFYGYSEFPIFKLNRFIEDLSVPLEEVIEVHGSNPFVLSDKDLERFKQSEYGLRSLIDWYTEIRFGEPRSKYLSGAQKRGVVENVHTIAACIVGTNTFSPDKLKPIVDDLQIPYSEVNQFIDYDIARANEVAILRSGTSTPQQSIQAAVQILQIPTDASSLTRLVDIFDDDPNTGVIGLVDLLYATNPAPIAALERKKIGKYETVDYLRQHLMSDSGNTSGSVGGELPPFLVISRIIPFETYQREATIRGHLVNLALRKYMAMPYDTAVQQIDSQAAANPNDKVLQNVLSEAKAYVHGINSMPERIRKVG